MPTICCPTFAAEPFTAITVLVSTASKSKSFASTLPAAVGSLDARFTMSPLLSSAIAIGSSFVPLTVIVSVAVAVAPPSDTV